MTKGDRKPVLIVIAGPNGSGKTVLGVNAFFIKEFWSDVNGTI